MGPRTARWRRRRDLYEILEERYGRHATILTSQIPVDKWHEIIGNQTYPDAILDRLVHNAHRIDLAGENLRRTRPDRCPAPDEAAPAEHGLPRWVHKAPSAHAAPSLVEALRDARGALLMDYLDKPPRQRD